MLPVNKNGHRGYQISLKKQIEVIFPDKSQDKADSVEKHTADQLIETFKKDTPSKNQAFAPLIQLFAEQFLDISIKKGLIDSDNLTLAGDGTPLPTSAKISSQEVLYL